MPEFHDQGKSMSFSAIKTMVCQRTGLTFDAYRTMVLKENITQHMAALEMDDMQTYCHEIRHKKELFDALVDGLTINESYFFREPIHLYLLPQWVLPGLLARYFDPIHGDRYGQIQIYSPVHRRCR